MRLTLPALWTLSILSISAALSSQSNDAVGGGGRRGGRRGGIGTARSNNSPRLSPIASSSSSTTADSIARKRKVPGAPLVDSALLRFVSKQKKEQEKRVQDVEDRSALESIGLATNETTIKTTITTTTRRSYDDKSIGNNNNNRNLESSSPASSSTSTSSTAGESPLGGDLDRPIIDPWMGQFNRNRIAQSLISLGAGEEQALEAGEQLQNHVLIRTARRRIRRFLRERDTFWLNDGIIPPPSSSDAATDSDQLIVQNNNGRSGSRGRSEISQVPSPALTESIKNDIDVGSIYGFDDILDVFVENGFTGTDIAATLIHTPSLALMMPRKSSLVDQTSSSSSSSSSTTTTTTVANVANGANSRQNLESYATSSIDGGGETLEQTIERAFHGLLLNTLGMRKYDARKVVRSCPGLLSVRGSKSAVQIVAMMTKLGVSTNSIARDKPNLPTLLSRPPADVFRLISFLSSSGVRMPIKTIGPLIRRLASRELLDTIAPVRNSQRISTGGGTQEETDDLESAIWSNTRAERTERINQVYRNMTETIWALRNEIGTKDLGKVIAAYPSVLLLDAEMKILPTATYLSDDLGIEGDLASVLQMYPILLGMEIEEFEKVSSYLVSLGVKKGDLGRIFRAFPALLTLDVEAKMMPVVEYLVSIGVDDLGMFITRLPPVLGYSVEDELKPKWEYLNKVCLQANFELKKFPAYFSYPFDRVIKTRYDYLAAKEIPRQLLPVDTVLRHGDIEFATKIARDVDGGKVFRAFSENRKRSRAEVIRRERKRNSKKRNTNPNRRNSNR